MSWLGIFHPRHTSRKPFLYEVNIQGLPFTVLVNSLDFTACFVILEPHFLMCCCYCSYLISYYHSDKQYSYLAFATTLPGSNWLSSIPIFIINSRTSDIVSHFTSFCLSLLFCSHSFFLNISFQLLYFLLFLSNLASNVLILNLYTIFAFSFIIPCLILFSLYCFLSTLHRISFSSFKCLRIGRNVRRERRAWTPIV